MFIVDRHISLEDAPISACVSSRHDLIFLVYQHSGIVALPLEGGDAVEILTTVPLGAPVDLRGAWSGACLTPDESTLIVAKEQGVFEFNHVERTEPKFLWAPEMHSIQVVSADCNNDVIVILCSIGNMVIIDRSATKILATASGIVSYVGLSPLTHTPSYPLPDSEEGVPHIHWPSFIHDIRCTNNSDECIVLGEGLFTYSPALFFFSASKGFRRVMKLQFPLGHDTSFEGCVEGRNPGEYIMFYRHYHGSARILCVGAKSQILARDETHLDAVQCISKLSGSVFTVLDEHGTRLTVFREVSMRMLFIDACVAVSKHASYV